MTNYDVTPELIPFLLILEDEISKDGKVDKTEEKIRKIAIQYAIEQRWILNRGAEISQIERALSEAYHQLKDLAGKYSQQKEYEEAKKRNQFILIPRFSRLKEAIISAEKPTFVAMQREDPYFDSSFGRTIFINKLVELSDRNILAAFGLLFPEQYAQLAINNTTSTGSTRYSLNHDLTQKLLGQTTAKALINDYKIDPVESEIMNVLFRVLCYEEKEIGITYRRKALTQITKIEHILGLDHTMQGINLHGDGLHSTRRSHIKNLLEEFSGIQYKIDGRKMPELIDSIKFIDEIKEEGMIFRDSGIALIILALKYFTRNPIYSSKMLTEILVSQINIKRKVITDEIERLKNPPNIGSITYKDKDGEPLVIHGLAGIYQEILMNQQTTREARSQQTTSVVDLTQEIKTRKV